MYNFYGAVYVLVKKKGVTFSSDSFLVWYHQESNRGHKDFQSFALPTELWHQLFFFCECKGNDIFLIAKIFANKSLFFVYFGRFYGRLCVCCDVPSVGSVDDAICLVFKQGFFWLQTRLVWSAKKACLWAKQGFFLRRCVCA